MTPAMTDDVRRAIGGRRAVAMAGSSQPSPALAQAANNTPLAFGMNVDEASRRWERRWSMSGAVPATKCFWRCPTSKAAPCRIGGTASICNSGAASLRAGKAIGGRTGHVADDGAAMSRAENFDGSRSARSHRRRRIGARRKARTSRSCKGMCRPPPGTMTAATTTRDFQNNGFFPGDFAANPAGAWIGAAGIFGFTPSGGSHFGPIYCTRRYRSHNPAPGYFQGDDGIWYRCQR